MALSALRCSKHLRFICGAKCQSVIGKTATITSVASRDPSYKRLPPFPYKEKKYGLWASTFDSTTKRFDENTRVIIVEGPVACGKTALAKKLAEELDMEYIPSADLVKELYIDYKGFDFRSINQYLPEKSQYLDIETFLKNPKHEARSAMQLWLFQLRLGHYVDALAHILNTGQGVVVENSVYSDYVFFETLLKFGYLSRNLFKFYKMIKRNSLMDLMRPHLVVYLDSSVDVTMRRIKERNHPNEANSPVLTREFLTELETKYKLDFLKNMSVHAEVAVYDWNEECDPEAIVEDIERIDMETFDTKEKKWQDWYLSQEHLWAVQRQLYTNDKHFVMGQVEIPFFDAPEIIMEPETLIILRNILEQVPSQQFAPGYNAAVGDVIYWK